MINRHLEYEDRPKVAKVGNNKHLRNIGYIKECITHLKGEASTREIFIWMNENTRNGIPRNELTQVLKKGPFIITGSVMVTNGVQNKKYPVNLWRINPGQ